MKFKLIFALFNGIIIASFVFVFLMPVLVLGGSYSFDFWGKNWYLIIVFVVILAVLDSYFIVNWKMFVLLEREDWSGLSALLEDKILFRKRFGDQDIRLLCNAYVVQGKPQEILKIEDGLRAFKPDAIFRYGILLGIPHLLQNKPADIIAYFEPLSHNKKTADKDWVDFNYAFGLMAERRVTEAAALLDEIAVQKRERIPQLLALYLLDTSTPADVPGAEARAVRLAAAKSAFRAAYSPATFERFLTKHKDNLLVLILNKFIVEAADWVFRGPANHAATRAPA